MWTLLDYLASAESVERAVYEESLDQKSQEASACGIVCSVAAALHKASAGSIEMAEYEMLGCDQSGFEHVCEWVSMFGREPHSQSDVQDVQICSPVPFHRFLLSSLPYPSSTKTSGKHPVRCHVLTVDRTPPCTPLLEASPLCPPLPVKRAYRQHTQPTVPVFTM